MPSPFESLLATLPKVEAAVASYPVPEWPANDEAKLLRDLAIIQYYALLKLVENGQRNVLNTRFDRSVRSQGVA